MSSDKPWPCPFKIYVDTAEGFPWPFSGLRTDSDHSYRPIVVETESLCLGRHPDSRGDYAPSCGVGRCHIERKSLEDCQSTILGFECGRRKRFECELANLAKIEAGVVIVEASLSTLMMTVQARGKRTQAQNAKTLFRSILAYQQDFRVQWLFCDNRRIAEITAFEWMYRWWKHAIKNPSAVTTTQTQQPENFAAELATL